MTKYGGALWQCGNQRSATQCIATLLTNYTQANSLVPIETLHKGWVAVLLWLTGTTYYADAGELDHAA